MPAPENVHQHGDDVCRRERKEHVIIARRSDEPPGNAAAETYADVVCAEERGVCRAALCGRG